MRRRSRHRFRNRVAVANIHRGFGVSQSDVVRDLILNQA
jgi:hypothetical protein